MFEIKNISSATVVLLENDYHFRRKMLPGKVVRVENDVYDGLTYDPGFQTFVRNGFLKVINLDENTDAEIIPTEGLALSMEEIRTIYEKKDVTAFSKAIVHASQATREAMASLAVEMKMVDNAFVALIKKYCNVDIMKAISTQEGV